MAVTRKQAIAEAQRFAEDTIHRVVDGVVGLIDKAIEVRRLEPMRFALYHYKMKLWRLAQGQKIRAGWHRKWEQHYRAKAWALDQTMAEKCFSCMDTV